MIILPSNYKIGCKNALLMIKNQLQTVFTKSQNKKIWLYSQLKLFILNFNNQNKIFTHDNFLILIQRTMDNGQRTINKFGGQFRVGYGHELSV